MQKIATHKFFDSYMKTWLDEHIWLVSQYIDCSQSPIFPWDRRDIARLTVNGGHLDFHDTHPRWQPTTHSARSRRSYGEIGDCEQSTRYNIVFLFRFACRKLVSVIWFLQIWPAIYVYGTMINWSTLIKKLMQTYIVIASGSILNVSTVHFNDIWHLIWRYLLKPVLGGHPVLSGHYIIPRGCPLNTGFTVAYLISLGNVIGGVLPSNELIWTCWLMRPRSRPDWLYWGYVFNRVTRMGVCKKILVSGDLRKCVNSFKNDPVKRFYEEDA